MQSLSNPTMCHCPIPTCLTAPSHHVSVPHLTGAFFINLVKSKTTILWLRRKEFVPKIYNCIRRSNNGNNDMGWLYLQTHVPLISSCTSVWACYRAGNLPTQIAAKQIQYNRWNVEAVLMGNTFNKLCGNVQIEAIRITFRVSVTKFVATMSPNMHHCHFWSQYRSR